MDQPHRKSFRYRARWAFPIVTAPVENAIITLADGRIQSVERYRHQTVDHDLGDAALIPALINAHTHLEFSGRTEPIPVNHGDMTSDAAFADWIRGVIAFRQTRDSGCNTAADQAIATGIRQSQAFAVSHIGDIVTVPTANAYESAADRANVGGVMFLELIGLQPRRIQDQIELATSFLQQSSAPRWQRGLSPHAPYSCSMDLLEAAIGLTSHHASPCPVAMHLAETREEIRLLADQTGPLREFLESLDIWRSTAFPRNGAPIDYLQRLAQPDRSLIIHGNYLSDEELDFIASFRDRMAVVYCPRTHAYFQHDAYPLTKMLSRNIRIAVGTDSLASNPTLSIWDELTAIANQHSLAADTLLQMATVNGAWGLGLTDGSGTLQRNAPADLAFVELGAEIAHDPYEALFAADQPPRRLTHHR